MVIDSEGNMMNPSEKFSNFAIRLAALYKASDYTQNKLKSTFNHIYDAVQGEKDLFSGEDTKGVTLKEAIKNELGIDYEPKKKNGATRDNDVAGRDQTSESGRPRGDESPSGGEQAKEGEGFADRRGGAADDSRERVDEARKRIEKHSGLSEAAPTEEQRKLGEVMAGLVKKAGIEVVTDAAEMERALNESLSQIWLDLTTPPAKAEVTSSSAKGAAKLQKIRENLAGLKEKYDGRANHKGAITDILEALGGDEQGYAHVPVNDDLEILVRVSNHNADAYTYAKRGAVGNNLSIVIKSRRSPNTFKAHPEVDLAEYVYTKEAISDDATILSKVADSLSEMLETGEFKDMSGKALVNRSPSEILQQMTAWHGSEHAHDRTQFLKTRNGEVYGFVKDGKMYLDPALMNPNTPMHEYTHLWDNALRAAKPELWSRGKDLMRELPLWDEVKNDPNYSDIAGDEDLLASEVHSRLSGPEGASLLDRMVSEAKKEGPIEAAKAITLRERIRKWLGEVLSWVRDAFGGKWGKEDLESLTLEEWSAMPVRDLARGVNPFKMVSKETSRLNADRELVAVHNLSADALRAALSLGGFPMPSIAITKGELGHTSFGDISLVFGKETVNPTDRRNKVYSADAWTPRFPKIAYKIDDKGVNGLKNRLEELLGEELTALYNVHNELHPSNLEDRINSNGSAVDSYASRAYMKLAYLKSQGKKVEIPRVPKDYGDISDKVLEIVRGRACRSKSCITKAMGDLNRIRNWSKPCRRRLTRRSWTSSRAAGITIR